MLILCRRDMSLTRRFNMWVSPEDVTSDKSIHLQTEAFRDLLREIDGQNLERDSRAFKLIVFVMDRSNISTPILKATLTEIISSLWKTFLISNQDYKEKVWEIFLTNLFQYNFRYLRRLIFSSIFWTWISLGAEYLILSNCPLSILIQPFQRCCSLHCKIFQFATMKPWNFIFLSFC